MVYTKIMKRTTREKRRRKRNDTLTGPQTIDKAIFYVKWNKLKKIKQFISFTFNWNGNYEYWPLSLMTSTKSNWITILSTQIFTAPAIHMKKNWSDPNDELDDKI